MSDNLIAVQLKIDSDVLQCAVYQELQSSWNVLAIDNWGDLVKQYPEAKILLILPGMHIISAYKNMPKGKRKDVTDALPYLFEEDIGDNVTSMHWVPVWDSRDDADGMWILYVDNEWLNGQLAICEEHGVQVVCVLPDYLFLVWQQKQYHIHCSGQQFIIRCGEYEGLSLSYNQQELLITLLQDGSLSQQPSCVISGEEKKVTQLQESLMKEDICCETVAAVDIFANAIERTKREWLKSDINLLAGDIEKKYSVAVDNKRGIWRAMGAMVATVMVLGVVQLGYRYYSLQSDIQLVEGVINSLYERVSQQPATIMEMRNLLERQLQQQQQTAAQRNEFMLLMEQFADVVQNSNQIQLQSVAFNNNSLDVTLVTDSFALLQLFTGELRASGLQVDQQQSGSSGEGLIQAQLYITKS